MSNTYKNEKRRNDPFAGDPSWWLKENNRTYRAEMRQLMRERRYDEIPVLQVDASYRIHRKGYYW